MSLGVVQSAYKQRNMRVGSFSPRLQSGTFSVVQSVQVPQLFLNYVYLASIDNRFSKGRISLAEWSTYGRLHLVTWTDPR